MVAQSQLPLLLRIALGGTGAASPGELHPPPLLPRSSLLIMINDMREQKAIYPATNWNQLCSALSSPGLLMALS